MIPAIFDGSKAVKAILADNTNGLGRLADAISCTVEENRNGSYTLEMEYPIDGQHFSEIVLGNIIKCTSSQFSDIQMFRIARISKPMNGHIVINANHISYDLNKSVVLPFSTVGIRDTMDAISTHSVVSTPFTFSSDIDNDATAFNSAVPKTIRSLLGGTDGSVLDSFHGEYEFDNLTVKLHAHRGSDRNVRIAYGKNLTDLKQEENLENFYTAVFPYAIGSDQSVTVGTLHTIVESSEPKILSLDLSSNFSSNQSEITVEAINSACDSYIEANNLNQPSISMDVSFVQLVMTEEYKDLAPIETVSLCDTVHIYFPKLGITAKAKVIKTVWNVLLDRYDSIGLGDAKSSFGNTIVKQAAELTNKKTFETTSRLERAIDDATTLITGGTGGYVVLKQNASGEPEELLVLADSDDYRQAKKIWRFNKNGLGYSSTGYNGKYALAMTANGEMVADLVTTGTLSADRVRTGLIADGDGTKDNAKNYWDLDSGEMHLSAYSTTSDMQTAIDTAESNANSHTDNALKSYYNKSEIDITANGIKSSVSSLATTVSENDTKAQGYADTAESNANSHTDDALKSYSTTVEMNSAISQSADSISSKVSKTYVGKSSIISEINQSAEEVTISASKINLDGYVTVGNLKDGSTAISGNNIKTGTLTIKGSNAASGIDVYNSSGSKIIDIDSSGMTISGTSWKSSALKIDSNGITIQPSTSVSGASTGKIVIGQNGIDVFNGSTRKLSICGGDITTFGDIYVCPSFSNVSSTYNIKMVGGSSANTTVLHVKNGAAKFDGNIGFFGAYPHAKTTLTASATLSQLISALKNYGLV